MVRSMFSPPARRCAAHEIRPGCHHNQGGYFHFRDHFVLLLPLYVARRATPTWIAFGHEASIIFASIERYPDVALQGRNFEIVVHNDTNPLGAGTSASSPSLTKPVPGFLNPFLDSTGSATFNHITTAHISGFICPASTVAFNAIVGWDPLSGSVRPGLLGCWLLLWRKRICNSFMISFLQVTGFKVSINSAFLINGPNISYLSWNLSK
ncbi:hypothetical protein K438DRAFT_2029970 [Mycena galopus ATCC 62051]|nr:hypothetical protein K438DRAFT_2029970 [Mycena galopus ATCC 62051]